MGYEPPRPAGSGADSRFFQWVYDSIKALRPMDTPNSLTSRTGRGFSIVTKAVSGGTVTTTPAGLKLFRFYEMKQDYILCTIGNALTFDALDTKSLMRIAKPPLLRFSVFNRTIHGESVTYDNYDLVKQERTAHLGGVGTIGTTDEVQVITDSYEVGDRIYAMKATTGVTVPVDDEDLARDPDTVVEYLDMNDDGRFWASKL
jgi:hypothetical protein